MLAVAGLGAAWRAGIRAFWLVSAGYVVLLGLYSGPLKHIVIIDVLTIAIGFVLRAVAGAVAIDVPISHWLLVCTILLALFLALSKRRHELVLLADGATDHRPNPRGVQPVSARPDDRRSSPPRRWSPTRSTPSVQRPWQKFGTDLLGLTIPFPFYGIFRYLYLVHRKEGGGSPAEMLRAPAAALLRGALGRSRS